MTTRIHTELRKLALAYYRGWVPREKYLTIRKDYLQSVSNNEQPMAIDPKKIAPPKKKTPPRPKADNSSNNKLLLIVAAIGVLLLVTIGIYLGQEPAPQKPKPAVNDSQPKQPEQVKPQLPLNDEQRFNTFLMDNLIGRRTWEQDALNSLKLKWLGLSQVQQENVSTTKTFQDFSGALVERIVDERKLNNIVPSDYELTLMTVAKNMGLINLIPDQ